MISESDEEYYSDEDDDEEEEAGDESEDDERIPRNVWIIKPGENSNCGYGISVI
jgi:hypothetical protein